MIDMKRRYDPTVNFKIKLSSEVIIGVSYTV